MDALIETTKLTKVYPGTTVAAVDALSLSVQGGEVYGFLGANGAGKSTTIRMLLNFIQPTSGSAAIMGMDSVKDSVAVKRHIGYLAGELSLYGTMTGRQFLEYMAQLQPVTDKAFRNTLAKRFEVPMDRPLRTLSKGNRQKIGLMQAFQHKPTVLMLDEPTSGLDPLMQEEFYRLIRESKDRGVAVFVSSHNFAEVERMCDRVGFIREGKLVAERTLSDLAQQAGHSFTLTFGDTTPVGELRKLPRATLTNHDEHHATISMEGELTPLFALLAKHRVTRLVQHEVSLEDEFLKFYRKAKS